MGSTAACSMPLLSLCLPPPLPPHVTRLPHVSVYVAQEELSLDHHIHRRRSRWPGSHGCARLYSPVREGWKLIQSTIPAVVLHSHLHLCADPLLPSSHRTLQAARAPARDLPNEEAPGLSSTIASRAPAPASRRGMRQASSLALPKVFASVYI